MPLRDVSVFSIRIPLNALVHRVFIHLPKRSIY